MNIIRLAASDIPPELLTSHMSCILDRILSRAFIANGQMDYAIALNIIRHWFGQQYRISDKDVDGIIEKAKQMFLEHGAINRPDTNCTMCGKTLLSKEWSKQDMNGHIFCDNEYERFASRCFNDNRLCQTRT